MKLIIDIPEVFYEASRKPNVIISGQRSGKSFMSVIYNAVANGAPYISNNVEIINGLIKQLEAMEPEVTVMDPNAWEVYDKVLDMLNNCLKEGD